jgi:hypothetical protein
MGIPFGIAKITVIKNQSKSNWFILSANYYQTDLAQYLVVQIEAEQV